VAELDNKFSSWVNQQIDADAGYAFSEAVRSPSIKRLREAGFPSRKDEEWRYTPLKELLESNPEILNKANVATEFIEDLKQAVPGAQSVVFVNGEYSSEYSDEASAEEMAGVQVSKLSQLSDDSLHRAEETIKQSSLTDDNIFQHIALGLGQNGLFIEVDKNVESKIPLHILHVATTGTAASFNNPIHLIRLSENSHFTIVEQFASVGQGKVITIPASYIHVEEGAQLDYYKVGNENARTNHVSNSSATVAPSATLRSHQYLLGSGLTRSNLEIKFAGSDAEAVLRGVYLGDEQQHLDIRTYMDHAYPHCSSDQHFRGILNGESRGVFNGLVLVREHAQKTDAQQSNKNLLLSRGARVDSKPQLEIFADDVKCAHGATIGELDSDALFYLQSRGIGKKEATLMLTRAFAAEITQEIEIDSLREYVQGKIATSLEEIVSTDV